MPLQPGSDAIVGGTTLRIPAIQSPNFVAGVSGWIVRQDGSAEFNTGTFRGSIEVGSLTGQHFWVNNPSTGDVIDVYNSSNQLVFSIDATGRVTSFSTVSTATIVMIAAGLLFEDTAQTPQAVPREFGAISATHTSLELDGGLPQNAVGGATIPFLQLNAGTAVASEYVAIGQRGVSGAVMESDSSTIPPTGNLVHVATYSITTDGTGASNFTHGCAFTPTQGFLSCQFLAGNVGFWQYAWFTNPFTSTNANAAFRDNLGAVVANKTLSAYGVFYG